MQPLEDMYCDVYKAAEVLGSSDRAGETRYACSRVGLMCTMVGRGEDD